MKKQPILLALLAILAGGGVFLFNSSSPGTVRMAYPPIVASLPMFIAEDQHLFHKHGVQLAKTVFESSNDMINSLVADQTDVLPAVSLIPIINLEIQYPGRVRLFSHSRMRPENAFDSIIVRSESPVASLDDLRGKKIGVFPGTSAANMLKAFLRKKGIDPNTITTIPLAPGVQLASLSSGAIDALFSYEPITTAAFKQPGYRRIFSSVYADLLNPCPIGASVISRRFEKRHAALARETIGLIDEAVGYMRAYPQESKRLLAQFTKISPDIVPSVNYVDVTLSTEVDVQNLQAFINFLHDIGEIPEAIDAKRLVAPSVEMP